MIARCVCFLAITAVLLVPARSYGQVFDDPVKSADFEKLINLLGDDLPDGAGVPVAHIEPGYPSQSHLEFSDITFYDAVVGQPSGVANHATSMGRRFYGRNQRFSLATGAKEVALYDAGTWLANLLPTASPPFELRVGQGGQAGPLAKVQNFSWVYSYNNNGFDQPAGNNERLLGRFDFQINRDDFTAVTGLSNNSSENLPYIGAYSYNAIVAGKSNGAHSTGLTQDGGNHAYGPGRAKPDLVADGSTVSAATATISSAATLLRGAAIGDLADSDRSEPIKAILLAGATKTPTRAASLSNWTWSRTTTQPLDDHYGAGELNIFNSYRIQAGGQFDGSTNANVAVAAGAHGWDYSTIAANDDLYYEFNIAEGITAQELSVILTWNTPGEQNNLGIGLDAPPLVNLDLELRDSSGALIDEAGVLSQSVSTLDNVEHVYLTDLAAGDYTLKVSSDGATDFGLAWRTETLADVVDADFNNNGEIDAIDFLLFQRGFGKHVNATHAEGDADGDGDVDADDLFALKSGYGGTSSINATQFAALLSTVPEPASGVLLAVGLLTLAGWRSRGRL